MSGLTTDEQCPRCGKDCHIKDGQIFCFKCRLYLPTYVCDVCGVAFVDASKLRKLEGAQFEEQEIERVCGLCYREVICLDGC